RGFDNIIFATDGKELKDFNIVEPVTKLQDQFKSDVTLFSVNTADHKFDWDESKIHIKNAHYATVDGSNIADEVTKFCKEKNADLLVVLPKHTGFFDRLFHKSVSKELVEQAKMPILSLENE